MAMCQWAQSFPMCRYTALRTSLILAAVLRPSLALIMLLCMAAGKMGDWLFVPLLGFMLISYAPVLCLDPALEESRAGQSAEMIAAWRLILIWSPCILPWIFFVPGVTEFVLKSLPLLWDWRVITGITVLCLLWLHRELRAALAFKPSSLYPNLKRY